MSESGLESNWLALIALMSWPLVAAVLFANVARSNAIVWTLLAGQLLLPVGAGIKIQMIPALDKSSIPNLSVLVGCLLLPHGRPRLPAAGLAEILILIYLIGPLVTCELNGDAILVGSAVLPGVGLYDAVSSIELAFILLIPFMIGRQYLRQPSDIRVVLGALAAAGVVYSLPLLFEVRFSPQLNLWVYGYYASEFIQAIRGGGFRPIVFMGHGLLAAHFAMLSAVAAAILWRLQQPLFGLPGAATTGYLAIVLLLCKSMGATVYAALLIPLTRWLTPHTQLRLATLLICVTLLYPALRSLDLFPTGLLVQSAAAFSQERADSLKFRFDNEDALLRHAMERPAFGWGRFGRNRLYDDDSGKDITVTDGRWIITLGQFGWFGFIAEFGLLSIGVMRALKALPLATSAADRAMLSGTALLVAISVLDLLPNSGLVPFIWLIAGALLGRAEAILATARQASGRAKLFATPSPPDPLNAKAERL